MGLFLPRNGITYARRFLNADLAGGFVARPYATIPAISSRWSARLPEPVY